MGHVHYVLAKKEGRGIFYPIYVFFELFHVEILHMSLLKINIICIISQGGVDVNVAIDLTYLPAVDSSFATDQLHDHSSSDAHADHSYSHPNSNGRDRDEL